jgi:hypothetical protein
VSEKIKGLSFTYAEGAGVETRAWIHRGATDVKESGKAIVWAEICPDCLRPSHAIHYKEQDLEQCECVTELGQRNMMVQIRALDEQCGTITYSRVLAERHGLELKFTGDAEFERQTAAYRG